MSECFKKQKQSHKIIEEHGSLEFKLSWTALDLHMVATELVDLMSDAYHNAVGHRLFPELQVRTSRSSCTAH